MSSANSQSLFPLLLPGCAERTLSIKLAFTFGLPVFSGFSSHTNFPSVASSLGVELDPFLERFFSFRLWYLALWR